MSEEEEAKRRGFEIIDRRGMNNLAIPVVAQPPYVASNQVVTHDRKWKSVGFMIVLNNTENGPLVIGRAVGLASDENLFCADYVFGPRWEAGFDWTIDAKRRLDSFLQCPCSLSNGPCPYHRRVAPQGWLKEDMDRMREDGLKAVPEAIEILARSERSRIQAQRILAPRR